MNWARFFITFFAIVGGFSAMVGFGFAVGWVSDTYGTGWGMGVFVVTFVLPLIVFMSAIVAKEDV